MALILINLFDIDQSAGDSHNFTGLSHRSNFWRVCIFDYGNWNDTEHV